MKFGQMILRKIIKVVATGCQSLRLKRTTINFEGGERKGSGGGKGTGEDGREGKGRLAIPMLVCFQRRCMVVVILESTLPCPATRVPVTSSRR